MPHKFTLLSKIAKRIIWRIFYVIFGNFFHQKVKVDSLLIIPSKENAEGTTIIQLFIVLTLTKDTCYNETVFWSIIFIVFVLKVTEFSYLNFFLSYCTILRQITTIYGKKKNLWLLKKDFYGLHGILFLQVAVGTCPLKVWEKQMVLTLCGSCIKCF